jgi:HK97 gp10 family phage protein
MATFDIKGQGNVTLDLRKLTQIRVKIGSGELEQAMSREVAMKTAEYIRENWSGYAPPRSSPGEPPSVDTGDLDEAIEVTRISGGEWRVQIDQSSTAAKYAVYLEYGTYKMEPRPFMLPAAEQVRQEYPEIAKIQWGKFFNSLRS